MATDRDLRAALNLLAERAPATCPVPGQHSPAEQRDSPDIARRPWGLVVAVAALVVLVAGIIVYSVGGVSGPNGSAPPATKPGPTTHVTCSSPSGREVGADREAIVKRAAALHASHVDVTATADTLRASMHGVGPAAVHDLCGTAALSFRGVVTHPVAVTCSGATCSSDAVAQAATNGGFAVPVTDTDYARLTAAEQAQLSTALAHFACKSAATAGSDYQVACADGNAAFLLGPAIVTSDQIDSASATAPDVHSGSTSWTIALTLSAAGRSRWAAYTTAHNTQGDSSVPSVEQCDASTTPCADYVGFTLDGLVISTPVSLSPITGDTTQIAGNFTAASAKALAVDLELGQLPVPLQLDNVYTVK
jgi:preprotein translocase subunit SecD